MTSREHLRRKKSPRITIVPPEPQVHVIYTDSLNLLSYADDKERLGVAGSISHQEYLSTLLTTCSREALSKQPRQQSALTLESGASLTPCMRAVGTPIEKAKSVGISPRAQQPASDLGAQIVSNKSCGGLGIKRAKSREKLLEETKKLMELGYCNSDFPAPVLTRSITSRSKRLPILNVAELWGKRMTLQVIKHSGYWDAYRILKTRGRTSGKSVRDLNFPSTPTRMDDNARRRLVFDSNERNVASILTKQAYPTLQIKKAKNSPLHPHPVSNLKMTSQVRQLITDCDTLQKATNHLQACLTPQSKPKSQKLRELSASERRRFDRIVRQL
jgi:hypothetical protein